MSSKIPVSISSSSSNTSSTSPSSCFPKSYSGSIFSCCRSKSRSPSEEDSYCSDEDSSYILEEDTDSDHGSQMDVLSLGSSYCSDDDSSCASDCYRPGLYRSKLKLLDDEDSYCSDEDEEGSGSGDDLQMDDLSLGSGYDPDDCSCASGELPAAPKATHQPPKETSCLCWGVGSICIPAKDGCPLIDVAVAHQVASLNPAAYHLRLSDFEVRLPPEVYPPQWDKRDVVEQAVIEAALMQLHTELIRQKIDSKQKHPTLTLKCKYSRRYYNPQTLQVIRGSRLKYSQVVTFQCLVKY